MRHNRIREEEVDEELAINTRVNFANWFSPSNKNPTTFVLIGHQHRDEDEIALDFKKIRGQRHRDGAID